MNNGYLTSIFQITVIVIISPLATFSLKAFNHCILYWITVQPIRVIKIAPIINSSLQYFQT